MGTRGLLLNWLKLYLWHSDDFLRDNANVKFNSLLQVAQEQAVQGLVCYALLKNNVKLERSDVFEAIALQQQIEQQNRIVNHELVKFVRELEQEGIDYIVVKGQTMAAHYPNPLVRMPGDVDMYFVGENYDKVKKYVEKQIGRELEKYSDGKHVEFTRNGVVFELHDTLSQLATRKHQRYFDQFIDEVIKYSDAIVTIDGHPVRTLPPTYNVLYTFMHLFFHMTAQGIGLRQFCDLAVLMGNTLNDEINKNELEERLLELGLMRAFNAVGSVLVEYIGLPFEKFPFDLSEKDKRWGQKILKNVMERGNFGRNQRHVANIGFLHSLESGFLVAKQAFVFFPLGPVEVGGRFFSIGNWFTKRLFLRN